MKVTMLIVKLLILGGLFIISNYDLHLGVEGEREEFYIRYGNWLDSLYDQGIQITAYVFKSEWLPKFENEKS